MKTNPKANVRSAVLCLCIISSTLTSRAYAQPITVTKQSEASTPQIENLDAQENSLLSSSLSVKEFSSRAKEYSAYWQKMGNESLKYQFLFLNLDHIQKSEVTNKRGKSSPKKCYPRPMILRLLILMQLSS